MIRSERQRTLTVTMIVVAVIGLLAFASGIPQWQTSASWNDTTAFEGSADAGSWKIQPPASSFAPFTPASTTTIEALSWNTPGTPADRVCATVTVRGLGATPQPWSLSLDVRSAPFNGQTTGYYYTGHSQVTTTLTGPHTLTIQGVSSANNPWNSEWNNATLTSDQQLIVTLCHSNPGIAAAADAAQYTVAVTQGEWSSQRACYTVTATVTDTSSPHYRGWQYTVDLGPAYALQVAQGRGTSYLQWSPWESGGHQYTLTPGADHTYTITSGRMTAIRPGSPAMITVCAIGR